MADANDSMEITSEHFQTGEDLDIDIDFSAGQADEDYILQDAQSNADYGNESPLQHLPVQDDPMIDDDGASYQMEDADLIHEGTVQDTEPDPMSFASGDIPISGATAAVASHGDGEDHDINLFDEDHYASIAARGDSLLVPQDDSRRHNAASAEDLSEQVDYSSTSQVLDEGQELVNKDLQPSHEPISKHCSPEVLQEELKSPASVSVSGPASPVHEIHDLATNPDHEPPEGTLRLQELETTELALDVSSARDVKVIYQSMEYALFATSDSDDPDSFFLRDLTVMEKPLDQFFNAIREIIQDDLSPEDELCLNVEDLGLETDEASSTLLNVTLAQMINLHQKLLHNDGLYTPGPLYLLLRTRISFSRRFTALSGGVSRGEGLSEFVMPDRNSESIDDVDEPENAALDIESSSHRKTLENIEHESAGDAENPNTSKRESTNHQTDVVESFEEGYQQPEDHEKYFVDVGTNDAETWGISLMHYDEQQISPQEEERRESYDDVEDEPELQIQMPPTRDHTHELGSDEDRSLLLNGSQRSPHRTDIAKALSKLAKEIVSSEEKEEEDLIDYSDEDTQLPLHPVGLPAAAANATNTEYQAKDEEFGRRSISRQAEEKFLEQDIGDSLEEPNGDEEDIESRETGYDEYNSELPTEGHGGPFDAADPTGDSLAGHEDSQVEFSNNPETFEDDEEIYEFEVEAGVEDVHDGSYGVSRVQDIDMEAELHGMESHTEAVQAEAPSTEHINPLENGHDRLAPSSASSLGAVETTESSVTLGGEDIQYEDDDELGEETPNEQAPAVPAVDSLQKDEIDYEDDEDDEVPTSISTRAINVTEVLSNSNGKRPLAEVESGMSAPIKDAKRPRS